MRASPSRRVRPIVVALGLLTWPALAPAEARAGCGERHDRPVVGLDWLTQTPVGDAVRPGERPAPFDPQDRPGPCPGGVCGPGRPAPVVPTAPAPPRVEHWPALMIEGAMPSPGSIFLHPAEPLDYVRPSLPALERPPRISERS